MLQPKPPRSRRVRPLPSTRSRLIDGRVRPEEKDRFIAAAVINLRLR
ncbi:hypothetical protein H9L21_10880 [Aeromicrobium senzhongii]|uniref:Transposase n=1 Tax=Aeromicrobium senzhongii TaxID=2663859 RepID=A0ABX6SR34_9ACTN|nr:hypothetical protein [Aeromicrobium senzhongii]QNL93613.1 hypothetical protein H9L21_10880 [Aeromicrobium senzhongii]